MQQRHEKPVDVVNGLRDVATVRLSLARTVSKLDTREKALRGALEDVDQWHGSNQLAIDMGDGSLLYCTRGPAGVETFRMPLHRAEHLTWSPPPADAIRAMTNPEIHPAEIADWNLPDEEQAEEQAREAKRVHDLQAIGRAKGGAW